MNKIYYLPYSQEKLAHSGVRGMAWGSNRWWTPDHKLTSAGREHYGYGTAREKYAGLFKRKTSEEKATEKKSELKSITAIESDAKDYATPDKKLEAVTQDCYLCTSSGIGDRNKEERRRAKEAADLGLKALIELGRLDEDDEVEDDDDWRDWFLYEDQTIGLGMVADLINQGYTSEQVGKLAKIVQDNELGIHSLGVESQAAKASFEIMSGNWDGSLETFAKACETVKSKGSSGPNAHGLKGPHWGIPDEAYEKLKNQKI